MLALALSEGTWTAYAAALASILLSSTAQILLKVVMRHATVGFHLLSQPLIYLGFLAYGLSAILWLQVLSRLPLVVAYPLVSLNFILVALGGSFILHERVGWTMLAGIALVVGGLVVMFQP